MERLIMIAAVMLAAAVLAERQITLPHYEDFESQGDTNISLTELVGGIRLWKDSTLY
jgi:hypothetical protein